MLWGCSAKPGSLGIWDWELEHLQNPSWPSHPQSCEYLYGVPPILIPSTEDPCYGIPNHALSQPKSINSFFIPTICAQSLAWIHRFLLKYPLLVSSFFISHSILLRILICISCLRLTAKDEGIKGRAAFFHCPPKKLLQLPG